jgi:glycosyltransferase involved in cell wall biosynthesis
MPARPIKLLIAIVEIHGGTGAFAHNLADGLRTYFPGEFQIDLLVMRSVSPTEADQKRFDHIHSADLSVSDDWHRFIETIPNALRLRRTLKSIDADVIFALHNFPSLMIPFVAPRRQVLKSVHTHLSTLLKNNITRPFLRQLIKRGYRKGLTIVPTPGIADDLAQNFGITSTQIIPHGIDLDRILRLSNEPVTDLPTPPYIISLGTLTTAKDYPTLLRAYALARAQGLRQNLVIVGTGELEQPLKALARSLHITDHIVFAGHRDNPYPYLKHADFFVLSSQSESFGLALLEAMTLALPTIATNTPGPAHILSGGKHGLLVQPASPPALADAILTLSRSPNRRAEFSQKSSARAQDFTLEKMTRQYRGLFHNLLEH